MKDSALIDRLASLSRLSFEGEARERMAADMESIMKLMDTVTAWDLPDEARPSADGEAELLRQDERGASMAVEDLLSNAKEKMHPFIAVQKLID